MSSSNSCYRSSCPEPVNVTINKTEIKIDNSPALSRVDFFSFGDSADNLTFGLSFFPYEPRSVSVFLNSGAQRFGIDYAVHGQYLVMQNPLVSGDSLMVRYLSVDGVVASQGSTVGSIISSAGSVLDGFLLMDGTSQYNWDVNLPLKQWFWASSSGVSGGIGNPADPVEPGKTRRDELLVAGYTTNVFSLVRIQDTVYDGSTLKTLNKFISRGAATGS